MDRRFLFWWWWLVVLAAAMIASGLALVVFSSAVEPLAADLFLSSPDAISEFGSTASAYIGLVSAILGAVMAGWAAAILYALVVPFRQMRPDAWWLIAISLVVWFVPDTTYSLLSGFWQNSVLNSISFVLFAIPLAATHRYFV